MKPPGEIKRERPWTMDDKRPTEDVFDIEDDCDDDDLDDDCFMCGDGPVTG